MKRDWFMKKLNEEDIQAYFQAGNSGFWKVEFEEGKKTKLYTDEITNELFGITEDMSPEKCMEYKVKEWSTMFGIMLFSYAI